MTKKELNALRRAVADYMRSEGCSCCRDHDEHIENRRKLGELLKLKPDDEGYVDFVPYRSPST